MAERFNAPVLKTGDPQGSVGSNPTPSARLIFNDLRRSTACYRNVHRNTSAVFHSIPSASEQNGRWELIPRTGLSGAVNYKPIKDSVHDRPPPRGGVIRRKTLSRFFPSSLSG